MLEHSLAVVRCLRPGMALLASAVVEAIMLTEGPIGSAHAVARRLGLSNRFQLARLLKREGLPPLHRIAEWATLESWVTLAERDGVSLSNIAIRTKKHASACYRLVKEITGLGWEDVRVLGSSWVQNEFSNRLRSRLVEYELPIPGSVDKRAGRAPYKGKALRTIRRPQVISE